MADFLFRFKTNGISSSIKKGLNTISNKAEAFFICLGDMPNVNQNIYNKLIKSRFNYNKKLRLEHKKEIIIPTVRKANDESGQIHLPSEKRNS